MKAKGIIATCALLCIITTSCGRAATPPAKTKEPILFSRLAGSWYPAAPQTLKKQIDGYLAAAHPVATTNIIALIMPHAGYRFSGKVAAYAMAAIKKRHFKRVIIIGPSHQYLLQNAISIPKVTAIETPLGKVGLDQDFIARLRKEEFTTEYPAAHLNEHSVQIEIPLLQRALRDFKIVPIVCGQIDLPTARAIGQTLLRLIDRDTLLVISSDFTHYGPRYNYLPFKKDVAANLRKLDMGAFEFIKKKDASGFVNYYRRTGDTICGRNPITILLTMLPQDASVTLLKYDTSGNITGDYTNSVSYFAIAFSGNWPTPSAVAIPEKAATSATLSTTDRHNLLLLARKSLAYFLKNGRVPTATDLDITVTSGMRRVMGAFVTLKENGNLRGCIGEISPYRELYQAVIERAIDAGVHDWRFTPVTTNELTKLDFEISALSPPHPVKSYKDIVLGKHGIVLIKGRHRAVYLPQVAPEQGWNTEQTLSHLAVKAGLPPDAWRSGCRFLVFEAIVFSENNHPG